MLLQKVAMVRGGGPSEPAAAPVLPFNPNGPIIKNLKQGHHQMDMQTSISPRPAQGRPPAQQRGRGLRPACPERPPRRGPPRPDGRPRGLRVGLLRLARGPGPFRRPGQGRPVIRGQERPDLQTVNGTEHVPCLLTQTWDAAIAVRDAVNRVLGFEVFIIPVLLLTDTPQDRLIEEWATQRRVKVLFGSDDLVGRLLELADSMGVKHPPTTDHIRNEVAAVTNGLVAPARDGGGHEAVREFIARHAIIQHVDTVNIHVTSANADGRGPQRLRAA